LRIDKWMPTTIRFLSQHVKIIKFDVCLTKKGALLSQLMVEDTIFVLLKSTQMKLEKKIEHLFFLFFPVLALAQKDVGIVYCEQYTINDGLSDNHVYQSYKDSRGILWLITERGLNSFDGHHFKLISSLEIKNASATSIFLEDNESEIWVGEIGGQVFCVDIYTERLRSAREKFGTCFPQKVFSAVKGTSGSYLVQTALDSIRRYTPGQNDAVLVYSEPGFAFSPVGESAQGTLLLEYNLREKGMEIRSFNPARKEMQVLARFSSAIYGRGAWGESMLYYITSDSFVVAGEHGVDQQRNIRAIFPKHRFEDAYINVQHAYMDAQQMAWLSTSEGLYKVRSKALPIQPVELKQPIKIVLTECLVFSGETKQEEDKRPDFFHTGEVTVQPNDHYLRVRFTRTDFSQSWENDYSYKIEGYKNEWQSTTENELLLAGLPYGRHELVVQVRTANGVFAGQELKVPIRVLRPLYLRWWFMALLLSFVFGAVAMYKKRRRMPVLKSTDPTWPLRQPSNQAAHIEFNTETVVEYMEITGQDQSAQETEKISSDEKNRKNTSPEAQVSLTPADQAFLEQLERIVLEHLEDLDFDTKMFYKAAGVSSSKLHRKLTALTGFSAGRYIYRIRLEEARQRIINTNLTIAEVAYQTGFSDPAYFTRLFTKMFDRTPSSFREEK
jgi:AraC-like DNA-binding protein